MNELKENIVILNRFEYDELQEDIKDLQNELDLKEKLYKIFEEYFWENLFKHEEYNFYHIEEENLDDYYFSDLVCKAIKEGITDIEYISGKIIEYKNKSEVKEDE